MRPATATSRCRYRYRYGAALIETINGRQFANRHDLMEHTGYTRDPLSRMWRDREENGHPAPRMINGVMHWDLKVWSAWFAEHNRQRRNDAARRRAARGSAKLAARGQAQQGR